MYFEYYLYTYFCLSVVILPCALANINTWFNSKTNSREKIKKNNSCKNAWRTVLQHLSIQT